MTLRSGTSSRRGLRRPEPPDADQAAVTDRAGTAVADPAVRARPDAAPPVAADGGATAAGASPWISRTQPGATREPSWWRGHLTQLTLLAIVVVGAVLRFSGDAWGLPLQLHPDEWVIVDGAMDMARRHSFEPPYFFRPDHLEMQLSNLVYLIYANWFHGQTPNAMFATDQAQFYLISRIITSCFGVGMIVLAYLIGRRFDTAVGLLAAFAVAFFPPFVINSHLATPDIPLSFAVLLVMLACMRYLTAPTRGHLLQAAFGVALAISIKYPGALGAVIIAIVVLVSGIRDRAWRRVIGHGVLALVAVAGFLFAISPVLFTDPASVGANLSGQAGGTHPGADGLGFLGNLQFYAADFATSAGLLVVVCAALGVFFCIRLRLAQAIPLCGGALIWIGLSDVGLHWPRWGLPMYLTPLLFAAIGIRHAAPVLLAAGRPRWMRWVAGVGSAAIAANLVVGTAAVVAQYLSVDTQIYGRADFAARHIDTQNSLFEGYSPLSPGASQLVFDDLEVVDGRLMVDESTPNRAQLQYVVLSSLIYDRYATESDVDSERQIYDLLNKQFPLLSTYRPVSLTPSPLEPLSIANAVGYLRDLASGALSGPTIKVYLIPPDRR